MLGKSLCGESSTLSISPLYMQTVDLVAFLHKLSVSENQEKHSVAVRLVAQIWDSLTVMCTKVAELDGPEAAKSLPRLSAFLASFATYKKNLEGIEDNKGKKLSKSTKELNPDESEPKEENLFLSPSSPLLELVSSLTLTANKKASTALSSCDHLGFLASLLSHFLSNDLLTKLTSALIHEQVTLTFFLQIGYIWIL